MDGSGVPPHGRLPARVGEPRAQVVVLEVEAVALVQPADLVERLAPHDRARERDELDVLDAGLLRRLPAGEAEADRERAAQREEVPVALPAAALAVDETRAADPEPRLL